MRGSGGASRPQRQARAGVTYKESDDDDDEFIPNAKLSSDVVGRRSLRSCALEVEDSMITKGRRTLALKRPRIIEPPVITEKENINADEIAEAPHEAEPALSHDYRHQFLQGLEFCRISANVPGSQRENSAFDYLLEAVSGASGDAYEEGASTGQQCFATKSSNQDESRAKQEVTTSTTYAPELLEAYSVFERTLNAVKGVMEEDTKATVTLTSPTHSSHEGGRLASSSAGEVLKNVVELERNREVEQDAISSANEKTGPKKGLEDKEVNMSSANEKTNRKRVKRDNQDNILYSDEKKDTKKIEDDKQCNVSSAEEEEDGDSEASWNESSDASDSDKKNSAIGKNDTLPSFEKSSPKLKTFVKKSKVFKKDLNCTDPVPSVAKSSKALYNLKCAPPLIPKKRPPIFAGNKPFVSPVPVPLSLPSPTVAHRRVVGLSRRHRPPPLHPYLLGT
ncbi:uncharacterized protein [Physcomitrium patens]|uniref:uncharacterized protein isoform X1 n=1 Tax=Physcomitrium patens TaxID=3218 RepID=UPI000D1600D8|nr:uncharacterized protein LOC112287669 isoform X1 [Physcomitrium patens]XP_024386696.1 uncharacterized protein LOC112287669 isoform X1 [Physcomitrium patens]|eukprot:XP_024386695.1 uncharacterized protein LOC112287669 isoform X1 [Physcomitrella patens]